MTVVSFTLQTRCTTTCNICQVRAAQREQLAEDVSGNTGKTGTPSASQSQPCQTTFNIKGIICFLHFQTGQFQAHTHPVQCHCHPSLTVVQAGFHQRCKVSLFGQIYRHDSAGIEGKAVFFTFLLLHKVTFLSVLTAVRPHCFRSLTVYSMMNFLH